MCEACGVAPVETPEHERPHSAFTRRAILTSAGLGALALPAIWLAGTDSAAEAATAKNGEWCNPALGYFPDGGHYGAPRGGAKHAGQDVTNSTGTGVYAAAAGKVVRRQWGGGLGGRTGNGIVIFHGNGCYTYYGHLDVYRVSLNQSVRAGQRIGDMGATGNVTGPHLHFEVHVGGLGSTRNPVPFMRDRGVILGGGWSTLDPGARGQRVKAIQHLLNQRGHDLVVDGDFGSVTTNAVKSFQSRAGLVRDGQVGPKTWAKLVVTLKKGHRGHHVRGLQTALNKRGAGLRVDGEFGSVTNTAVRNYQSVNRLVVDGVAGAVTWRALVG